MSKTKAQLEEENKKLRKYIKELQTDLKQTSKSVKDSSMKDLGFSIIKQEGNYKMVKLAFNRDNYKASVTEIQDASTNPIANHMALYEAKKFLVEVIMDRAEKE